VVKRLLLCFTILTLVAASAATYKVNLLQPSVVKGATLKMGEYRLNVGESSVTIVNGKNSIDVPVKVENSETKFDKTSVRYSMESGKATISEIRIGGTKTRLVFNP
jgi:hypothetical protein